VREEGGVQCGIVKRMWMEMDRNRGFEEVD